ncbi:MAG: pentapeptide repeat-containing protein [Nostocaceae cyanobacterium]|nr:pentapeptide repeat-containing protein [Nostocaceae cyanobacterium]
MYDFKTKFPPNTDVRQAHIICAGTILNGKEFYRVNLQDAILCNAQLRKIKFAYANLKGANLKGAILKGANLKYAQLKNANLSYANLNDVSLYRASLVNVNLQGVILQNANLSFADLRGANLENAKLNDANLADIIYNNKTVFPDGIDLSNAHFSSKDPDDSSNNFTLVKLVKSPLLEALERIEFKGDFYPGLTRKEIDEITKDLPFSFPEELYELYQWLA